MLTAPLVLVPLLIGAEPPAGVAAMPPGVLIEAELFAPAERWEVQTELPGFSGRGYLVNRSRPAISDTSPRLETVLPKAGRHAVWLRAFCGGPPDSGFHDREFSLEVNGVRLQPTHLGVDGADFTWELAGQIEVAADRRLEFILHDVGRAEAMIDALLLTTDLEFRPAGWLGNSTRPGQGRFPRLPDARPLRAEPFRLVPAPHQHVQTISSSPRAYPVIVGGTLDEFNTAKYPDTYGGSKRIDWGFQPNAYVVIENVGRRDLVNPRLVVDGRRDWFSAQTMLASLLAPGMSDAEKALAIWAFTAGIEVQGHENNRRVGPYYPDVRSHPSRNTFQERADPVKAANTYYCSGCNYGAANCAVLARAAGLPARCVWMCPFDQYEIHCVAEVFFDGRWHLLDPECRVFYLEADNRTVASYETLHRRPELAARTHEGGFAARYMARSHAEHYQRYSPPPGMPVDTWTTEMAVRLRPGEKLVYRWAHDGKFRCGQNPRNRNLLPYHLSNGKLIYQPDLRAASSRHGILAERNVKTAVEDGRGAAVHADTPGLTSSVTYKMQSPWPIVGGVVGAKFVRANPQDRMRILLSANDSDWTEIWSAAPGRHGPLDVCLAIDSLLEARFGPEQREYYVQYEFSADSPAATGLDSVYLEADLQMAATALPSLAAGPNQVVYRDQTDAERCVRIVHGWQESSATRPPVAPRGPVAPADRSTLPAAPDKLVWSAAADPDGDPIADYHVQLSARSDFRWPVSPNFDHLTESPSCQWPVPTGWLISGQTYSWRVRARDARGAWSPWSPAWQFTLRRPDRAPTGLRPPQRGDAE